MRDQDDRWLRAWTWLFAVFGLPFTISAVLVESYLVAALFLLMTILALGKLYQEENGTND